MQKTYLFYDIETTGLSPSFDQVLQFAGIRTDENFNIIDEQEVQIHLRDDLVPAPEAVLTHLISPEKMREGLSEVDGIQKIHAIMNEPGTTSLGYNTLGFDDEFLRFSFYRNLLTPYTHQFANGCSRMDIFPITILFYLFGECNLTWPKLKDRVSLKLEKINEANQLAQGQAHDAMVDVRATLALAKILKQNSNMWDYAAAYFDKNTDIQRNRQLPYAFSDTAYQEGILIDSKLGYGQHFQSYALCLGQHRHYRNQYCWLRLDLDTLSETTPDSIEQTTWCIKKKLAEAPMVLPPKSRFLKYFDEARITTIENNKEFLKNKPNLLKAITDHYLDYKYPVTPEADLDSILYQSEFLSRADQNTALNFHQARPELKANFIENFETTENQALALRIIGRHFPGCLPDHYQAEYEQYRDHCFEAIDYAGREKLSPAVALDRLTTLDSQFLTNPQLIKELKAFYSSLIA